MSRYLRCAGSVLFFLWLTSGLIGCASTLGSATGSTAISEGPKEPPKLARLVLAETDFPTQRLFRLRYDGPDGSGSGRLTLRLESPERFEIAVADAFGRAVWTLGADAEHGLLIDHRRRTACFLDSGVTLAKFLPSPVPLRAVPALLLGRLPVVGEMTSTEDDEFRLVDRAGREWVARQSADGTLVAWTLWVDGHPSAWWQRLESGESLLSERQAGVQLRWRESVSEAMPEALPGLSPPADYSPGDCSELDLRLATPES